MMASAALSLCLSLPNLGCSIFILSKKKHASSQRDSLASVVLTYQIKALPLFAAAMRENHARSNRKLGTHTLAPIKDRFAFSPLRPATNRSSSITPPSAISLVCHETGRAYHHICLAHETISVQSPACLISKALRPCMDALSPRFFRLGSVWLIRSNRATLSL